MNPSIGAQRINLQTGGGLEADGRELRISSGGVSGDMLSSGAKTAVLTSKVVQYDLRSSVLSSPAANHMSVSIGSAPYATDDDSAAGVLALLAGAGASNEFDTATGKIGASASPNEAAYKLAVFTENGALLENASGVQVWAVLVVDSRTSPGVGFPKAYFFSGPFSSSATAETVSVNIFIDYTTQSTLSSMPKQAFRQALASIVDTEGGAVESMAGYAKVIGDSADGDTIVLANAVLETQIAGVHVTADGGPLDYVPYGFGSGAAGAPSVDEFTIDPAHLDEIILGEAQIDDVVYRISWQHAVV